MTRPCREHEIEIGAAAGAALEPEVERHLEECAGCRALRRETLAMAGAARVEAGAPAAGLRALAREAVEEARGRRPALWAVPLLSASASAAALILYFGIFHAAAEPVESTVGNSPRTEQTVTADTQVTLPDSLQAVSDLLLVQPGKESRR